MRRFFSIFLISLFSIAYSQTDTSNPFADAEQENTTNNGGGEQEEDGPGNAGEPVPVNQYIPYLLIGGMVYIIAVGFRKKSQQKI